MTDTEPAVQALDDIYPNGRGCPECDGTGFVSDERIARLRAAGHRVPWSEYPEGTAHTDPDSPIARDALHPEPREDER